MSFATLAVATSGVQFTHDSEAEYAAAYPEQATNWSKVHTVEVCIYLAGTEHIGKSYVNWMEGGHCEWCLRTDHATDQHATVYPNDQRTLV